MLIVLHFVKCSLFVQCIWYIKWDIYALIIFWCKSFKLLDLDIMRVDTQTTVNLLLFFDALKFLGRWSTTKGHGKRKYKRKNIKPRIIKIDNFLLSCTFPKYYYSLMIIDENFEILVLWKMKIASQIHWFGRFSGDWPIFRWKYMMIIIYLHATNCKNRRF